MRSVVLAGIVAVAAAIAGGTALQAQSGTLSVVAGAVVDAQGDPLPGVTITASSSSSAIAPAGTVTNVRGRYRILPLPPGRDYRVVAELPGYARVEVGPVQLDPGRTTKLDFTLVLASATTEKITVVGHGDMIDLTSTKTATVFNGEFIEGLPILGRTYQDLLTLAPGVTDVDGDGNPNVNGARATNFQTRLDGANITDPLTGTFGQNLNIESIAEIEVITTGASAEFSQAQGGFANIITKSGGNDFEGAFKFYFRSDLFDNDGANNNDVTDVNLFAGASGFKDLRPFLSVGGPIVRDHLWYFAALEYIHLETPVNTLRFPVVRTQEGWNNFLKFTWQVDPSNRLSLQVNHDPLLFTGLGVGTQVAPDSGFVYDQGGTTGTARWTYNISPSVLLETLVSRYDTGVDLLPSKNPDPCLSDELGRCNPFVEDLYTVNGRQGTIHGPYFETSRDTRLRHTLKSDLSLFFEPDHGTHQIKAGFELSQEAYENALEVRRIRFDNYVALPRRGAGATGPNLAGFINFEEAVPSSQTREATKDNYGLYVQDSFKPIPNLSINVGLRYDREEATSEGFDPFDPEAQAEEFLQLYARASDTPLGSVNFAQAFADGDVLYDVNGDGLDFLHCTDYDIDGAAFGDGTSDGASDDFWTYADLASTNPDGTFNPFVPDGVVDCDNPFDTCVQAPDGLADGRSINPACDRLSDDAFVVISVFSRHQFDDIATPFETVVLMDPERGLPGRLRDHERFTIVNNNVAPRLSVSWDPWGNNRTKLFATWSRFYDKLFLATLVPELGPDPRTSVYDPNSQQLGASAIPVQRGRFSVTQVDRGMKTPFTDEMTLGFERELAPEWVFSFTYVRRRGRDQLQDVDVNHYTRDLNGDGILDDNFGTVGFIQPSDDNPAAPGDLNLRGVATTPDGQPDLFAFNPFFNQILRVGSFNSSAYDSYQFVLTRRLSRKWQLTSSYVYSKAVGDAEFFLQSFGDDLGSVDDEYGPLSFDQTHRLVFSGVTFLPGDQTVGGTVEWASGLPYSLIRQGESADSFGSFTFRTTYPTGQRNDHRNEPTWLLKLLYRKRFHLDRLQAAVTVEVDNLLGSDDLRIRRVNTEQFLGLSATRRFGRRWQLSAEFHF